MSLKPSLKVFNDIKTQCPDKLVRIQYFQPFVCNWMLISDFILKNRAYGDFVGKEKTLLKKHLKFFKFSKLRAILRDAAGYLQEKHKTWLHIFFAMTNKKKHSNQSYFLCWNAE